jgi:thymidylate synthase (FAD)
MKEKESLLFYNDFISSDFLEYAFLKKRGLKGEDARYILPNAMATKIAVSGNFRVWFEFFQKRLDSHAQWEIRGAAQEAFKILSTYAPHVFNKENILRQPPINIEWGWEDVD